MYQYTFLYVFGIRLLVGACIHQSYTHEHPLKLLLHVHTDINMQRQIFEKRKHLLFTFRDTRDLLFLLKTLEGSAQCLRHFLIGSRSEWWHSCIIGNICNDKIKQWLECGNVLSDLLCKYNVVNDAGFYSLLNRYAKKTSPMSSNG